MHTTKKQKAYEKKTIVAAVAGSLIAGLTCTTTAALYTVYPESFHYQSRSGWY
jgi:hypothetical protein